MSSTDSKTYQAAIREIDAAKKHISTLETSILEQMEIVEQAEKEIAEHESDISRMSAEKDEKLHAFEEQTRAQTEEVDSPARQTRTSHGVCCRNR